MTTKLKSLNCDKTLELKLQQNSIAQLVAKRKNSNCDKTQTQIVTKLKNSNFDNSIFDKT